MPSLTKADEASGWSRDKENPTMITKKYDPHAALRAKSYSKTQASHHAARMSALKSGCTPQTTACNNAGTFESRRTAVLLKKAAAREEKVNKAKRMNERAAANRERIKNAGSVSEVRVDVTRKVNACNVCATCGGAEKLEEDSDAVGVFYCGPCWESWEN